MSLFIMDGCTAMRICSFGGIRDVRVLPSVEGGRLDGSA